MHNPRLTTLVALLALVGLLTLPMQLTAAGTTTYLSLIMGGDPACVNLPVPTGGPAAAAMLQNPGLCAPTPTNTPTPTSAPTDTATPTNTPTATSTATSTPTPRPPAN